MVGVESLTFPLLGIIKSNIHKDESNFKNDSCNHGEVTALESDCKSIQKKFNNDQNSYLIHNIHIKRPVDTSAQKWILAARLPLNQNTIPVYISCTKHLQIPFYYNIQCIVLTPTVHPLSNFWHIRFEIIITHLDIQREAILAHTPIYIFAILSIRFAAMRFHHFVIRRTVETILPWIFQRILDGGYDARCRCRHCSCVRWHCTPLLNWILFSNIYNIHLDIIYSFNSVMPQQKCNNGKIYVFWSVKIELSSWDDICSKFIYTTWEKSL